jgi:hypothetical protein
MSQPIALESEEIIGSQRSQIRGIYSGPDAAVSVAGFARDRNYILTFKSLATGHVVSFPSIIDSFNDTHTAQINEKTFLGVMNPTATQGGTGRQISLTFKILSASLDEARYNTQSVNMLLQMMYPSINPEGRPISDPYIQASGFGMLKDGTSVGSTKLVIQNITYSIDTDQGYIMAKDTSEGELHPVSLVVDISAIAILPTDYSDEAPQPYPSDYPRYR